MFLSGTLSNSQYFELRSSVQLEDAISEVLAKIGKLFSDSDFWTGPETIHPKRDSRMTTPLPLIRLSNITSSSTSAPRRMSILPGTLNVGSANCRWLTSRNSEISIGFVGISFVIFGITWRMAQ